MFLIFFEHHELSPICGEPSEPATFWNFLSHFHNVARAHTLESEVAQMFGSRFGNMPMRLATMRSTSRAGSKRGNTQSNR